jgi:hypothetical protein
MQKICPFCGNSFECKNDDILNCDCIHVKICPEARSYIAQHYDDCLCVSCLRAINKEFISQPVNIQQV